MVAKYGHCFPTAFDSLLARIGLVGMLTQACHGDAPLAVIDALIAAGADLYVVDDDCEPLEECIKVIASKPA